MKKILSFLSCLISLQIYGQETVTDFLEDFDKGVLAVERNYAGFSDKVDDWVQWMAGWLNAH